MYQIEFYINVEIIPYCTNQAIQIIVKVEIRIYPITQLVKRNSLLRNRSYSYSNPCEMDTSNSNNLIAKRKQTITLCLVSLTFFFCQIPVKIFQIFNSFYQFESVSEEYDVMIFKRMNIIFLLSKLLYYLHSMSNPIIYNLMSTKFNRSFKNVIFCKPINNYKKNGFQQKWNFRNSNISNKNSI